MQRPEQAHQQPEAQEAPPTERGVEDILAEAGELIEAKESTIEEQHEQWKELKADEESARLQLIQAQTRIDVPDLDVGLRNLGLALARVGIEARLQAIQTLEGAASDPMAPEAVRSAAAQLQKIEDARRALAAREIPKDRAADQQRLIKELEERAQRVRSDVGPTLQQLHERVQKDLEPDAAALDAEIATTPELMAARRAAAEAEIGALKERVSAREAARTELTADWRVREKLAEQAGKEAHAATEAQLATPEGRAAFVQSELPRILKESGILLSPRDADAEYERRKTAAGKHYPRKQFARDLLDDLQRAAGGDSRSYDAQKKYDQQFGGSHTRTWEAVIRAVAIGLPGEDVRDRYGAPTKLFERLRGYTEALAMGRGDIEEAQVGETLQSLQEALGKSMEDPRATERMLPGIADAVAQRERIRFKGEAGVLDAVRLETKSLGELTSTAEGIIAELAALRESYRVDTAAVEDLKKQLRTTEEVTRKFDWERDRRRSALRGYHEEGIRAMETRTAELRHDLQQSEAAQRQQRETLQREQSIVEQKRNLYAEKQRETERWLGTEVKGTSVAAVLEGKAQAAIQTDIAALDQQIADRNAKKPRFFGRKQAEAEIRSLAGRRQALTASLADLNKYHEDLRAERDRQDIKQQVAAREIQDAEVRMRGLQEPLQSADTRIAALRSKIEATNGELGRARQAMDDALDTFSQETETLRQGILAEHGSSESIRQQVHATDRRLDALAERLSELHAQAQKSQQEQPTSTTLRAEADRLRSESVTLQAARERFAQAKNGLDAFLEAAKSATRDGREPFYGPSTKKLLGTE